MFQDIKGYINLYTKRTHHLCGKINPELSTLNHIQVKLLEFKDKEKIPEISKGKKKKKQEITRTRELDWHRTAQKQHMSNTTMEQQL